jgi:hypothetical protein
MAVSLDLGDEAPTYNIIRFSLSRYSRYTARENQADEKRFNAPLGVIDLLVDQLKTYRSLPSFYRNGARI